MDNKWISIVGGKENNLKSVNVNIPKNQLVVFTGVSGSGKSSLAFDTIFAEGQRRYIQSLSSYARQFIGEYKKPDCDSIEGLQPSISIDQKTTTNNPRSTVGTVTEIYDYMRLLWARIGTPYCPNHNIPIQPFSIQQLVDIIYQQEENTKLTIWSPVVKNEKGTHVETLQKYINAGFTKIKIDDNPIQRYTYVPTLDKSNKHTIDFQIDKISINENNKSRIFDSLRVALDYAKGYVELQFDDKPLSLYSTHSSCPICGFSVPPLEPRLFSFNNPLGACQDCHGLGIKISSDPYLLIPDDSLSINKGAIKPYGKPKANNTDWIKLKALCDSENISFTTPIKDLTEKQMHTLLYGPKKPLELDLKLSTGSILKTKITEGIKTKIDRLFQETKSEWMKDWYNTFMSESICSTCNGARLNNLVLAVKINNLSIYDACCLSFTKLYDFIKNLNLTPTQVKVSKLVTKEILDRLSFLIEVGLDYLTLSRMAKTLSGGESQRIRLATQMGSKLSGILYVLDEPSIGLHQKDNSKLIHTLQEMRDLGNSLIVVEHDEETIRSADYIVDIGPGAGKHGGEIVVSGTLNDVMNCPNSITGAFLTGKEKIETPKMRRKTTHWITIHNATCHNLKNITVDIPLGEFVCVTGVSGSGKSSLINECLYKKILESKSRVHVHPGECGPIDGIKQFTNVVNVSQEPIGKTPRSNPATYLGIFDEIRELFSQTLLAKTKGITKSMFSFNIPGGRCETCSGGGIVRIKMDFLPDVYVTCDVCHGKRYSDDVLSIEYKGKNISDILNMTIEDAYTFFQAIPSIKRRIKALIDVGLGYMSLGQPSTQMSGGEAQRIKIANELQRKSNGKMLYILDEPTTGLHSYDVRNLINVLEELVNQGNTIIVIEHNLDLIKCADYIIDLGPEGGDNGGSVIAKGTPEEVMMVESSYTGQYLKKMLKEK